MKKTPLRIFASLLAASALAVTAAAYTVNLHDGESVKTLTGTDGAKCTIDESDPALVDLEHNRWLVGYRNEAGDMLVGTSFSPTGNVDLYAVWAPLDDGTPGVNAFTCYDFETPGQLLRVNNGYGMIVEDPKDPTNHCYFYKRGSGYAKIVQSVAWETGRKYHISLDILQDKATSFCYYVGYGSNSTTTLSQPSMKANEWTHLTYDFTFAYTAGNPTYDFVRFYPNPGAATNDVYYDNVSIVPFNKITYDACGGIGAPAAAYQLGGTYTVDTATVPVRSGYIFKGWALPTAATAVSSIELGKGDVTLYALWERDPDAPAFAYAPATSNAGVADGKLILFPDSPAYEGNTASLYYSSDNTKYNTPFGYMTIEDGMAEYTFPSGTLLYEGVDQFVAEFADGMSYTVDIPANKQKDGSKFIVVLRDGESVTVNYVTPGNKLTLPEYETRTRDAVTYVGKINEYQLGWQEEGGDALFATFMYPDRDYILDKVWAPMTIAVPGVNMYRNGDFENGNYIDVRPSNGPIFLEEEEDGNHCIRYNRGSGYASIQHFVGFEAGRTYKISFRVKTETPISVNYNPIYNAKDNPYSACTTTAGKWVSVEKTWTAPADYVTRPTTDFMSFYGNPPQCDMWFDDLSVIPYAKITYDANGGTGAPAPASIPGGDYKIDTATIPVRRGFKFVGWNTDKNATSGMDFVKAVSGDVTLYAIWELNDAQNMFDYEYATDKQGIADGTISIFLPLDMPNYTAVKLYYASENGILPGYTELASLPVVDGAAVLNITGSHVFPKGASMIKSVFSGDGLADMTVDYVIPEERRFDSSASPKFTYFQVSDPHCGGDYWSTIPVNRNNAVKDIQAMNPDFVAIGGDFVNNSNATNFAAFDSFIKTNFNDKGIPAFIVNGNHEFHVSDSPSTSYDRTSLLSSYAKQFAVNESMGYSINRPDPEGLYYSVELEGCKFIFMSCPSPIKDYAIGADQLAFIDEELYDCEKSNKPAFIVSHVGFGSLIPYGGSGITNAAAVEEVLSRHPNVLFASGHTHSDISENVIGDKTQYVRVGDMSSTFSHLNDGCMIWLEVPKSDAYPDGYKKEYSVGFYIEVYDDKILVEGREFLDESKYIAYCMYQIDLPGADVEIPDVWMDGELEEGAEIKAIVDGEIAPSGYTYEWIVNGSVVGTEGIYTVHKDSTFGGRKLALRVTDPANGTYSSYLSENVFDSKTVTYDANGGTGAVPAPVKVAPNTDYPLDQGGNGNPKKEGKFFVGWSDDPYASVPMTSVKILEDDKTVYAVYIDKPDIQFDTNLSGFTKNSYATAEIVDGKLHVVSNVGDPIMNGSGFNSFPAEKYPVFRIKYKTVSGSMDGFFFATAAQSYAEKTHMYLQSAALKPFYEAAVDGYTVREYNMPALFPDYWKNTITGVRFDVLAGVGEAYVDYFTFSENMGIYDAALTINFGETDPANIGVGSDLYTVESVKWNGNQAIIFIKAEEGFEFPDADLLAANATVNGNPVDEASVFGDTARLIATVVPCIDFGSGSVAHIKLKSAIMDNTVVAALYDADGRLIAVKMEENFSADGILNILLGNHGPMTNIVKLFVFKDSASMAPVCEPYIVDRGNLIPDGTADGEECIFGNVSDQIGKVTVSILADTDNRFFAVRPNNNTEQWCYASYDDITYEAGRTYQVEADIRVAAQGTNTDLADDFSASINVNFVFADSTLDHIAKQNTVKVSDGWKHISFTYTIPADKTDRSKDAFRIYSNPVSSIGVGFDIDNVVVKPL